MKKIFIALILCSFSVVVAMEDAASLTKEIEDSVKQQEQLTAGLHHIGDAIKEGQRKARPTEDRRGPTIETKPSISRKRALSRETINHD